MSDTSQTAGDHPLNRTTLRPVLVAAALLAGLGSVPSVAAPETVEIPSDLGPGTRVHRELSHDLTLKIEESGEKPLVFQVDRTIDALVDVISDERLRVEFPRARTHTTAAQGGQAQGDSTFADPIHGVTLRFDGVPAVARAEPVAGPTPKALPPYLAGSLGDPLRRPFVPTAAVSTGEACTLPAGAITNTLGNVLPLPLMRTEPLVLSLETTAGSGEAATITLLGAVTSTVQVRVPTFEVTQFAIDLTLELEVLRETGLLRSLTLRGSRSIDVESGSRKARVTITFDVTERATSHPAGWVFPRPEDAWTPVPTLAPQFDDRAWQVIHHVQMSTDNPQAITEWSLGDVKLKAGTEKGWVELVTVQRYPYSDGPPPIERFYEMKRDEVRRSAPTADWRILRKTPTSMEYEWTLRGNPGYADQHELGRLVRLGDVVLQIRYTHKVPALPPGDRLAWLRRLRTAKVVHPR